MFCHAKTLARVFTPPFSLVLPNLLYSVAPISSKQASNLGIMWLFFYKLKLLTSLDSIYVDLKATIVFRYPKLYNNIYLSY